MPKFGSLRNSNVDDALRDCFGGRVFRSELFLSLSLYIYIYGTLTPSHKSGKK